MAGRRQDFRTKLLRQSSELLHRIRILHDIEISHVQDLRPGLYGVSSGFHYVCLRIRYRLSLLARRTASIIERLKERQASRLNTYALVVVASTSEGPATCYRGGSVSLVRRSVKRARNRFCMLAIMLFTDRSCLSKFTISVLYSLEKNSQFLVSLSVLLDFI